MYDMTQMTCADYERAFEASTSKLTPLWGNQQLQDLTEFRLAGGKLLTWFGLADEYIPPPGMLRYREAVEQKFGGAELVDDFYRLFLAPGAGHCFGGVGPVPTDPLEALIAWVERGEAPDTLPATKVREDDGVDVSRNLCRYPKKLVYKGGDLHRADSFTCK